MTRGNNDGYGVRGFPAPRGYDVATGWGTVDAARFGAHPRDRRGAVLSLARSATGTVTGRGFLPDHPVRVSVDGTRVATVTR